MTTPMYREIAEQLRERIESGEFGSGTQMPTEQDLQAQHNASRNTIREAIKPVATLGLVGPSLARAPSSSRSLNPS